MHSIGSHTLTHQWSLDALGNWSGFNQDDDGDGNYEENEDLQQEREHNLVNEIEDDGEAPTGSIRVQSEGVGDNWHDPVYDDAGNMTEGPQPAAETAKQQYTYDAWNRLVEVKDNSNALVAQYEYDGLGRRIAKYLPARVASANSVHFYYHGQQVVEERQGLFNAANPPVETIEGNANAQYVYHPYYIDAPAVRWYDANEDNGFGDANELQCYTHDANFNVTALLDESANVLVLYDYDP